MSTHGRSSLAPLLLALLLLATSELSAGERDDEWDRILLEDLLSLKAAPSDWKTQAEIWNDRLPVGQRIGPDGVPEDDAALDILVAFWADDIARWERKTLRPGPRVRKRLFEACLEKPELFRNLRPFLPNTHDVHLRLIELLGDPDAVTPSDEPWKGLIREWLLLRCRLRAPQLAEAAGRTHDRDGLVRGRQYLRTLAENAWKTAEPVLLKLLEGDQPKTKALAASLMYRHAVQVGHSGRIRKWRERLKNTVEDPRQPGLARLVAFEELMRSEWDGRDEWYISRFSDPTFRWAREGNTCWPTVASPVREDPDRWIPVMSRLIGHEDRNVHNAAVTCLIQFQLEHARADALRPLLPWLEDKNWCDALYFSERLCLIQSLSFVEFPEALPALIRIVETEDGFERAGAAAALGRLADPRAAPALRSALDRESNGYNRREILAALVACDGLTDEEIARGIVAYAKYDPDGDKARKRDVRFPLGEDSDLDGKHYVGSIMREPDFATESRAKALVAWFATHQPADASTLQAVAGILAAWDTGTSIRYAVHQLREHRLSANGVLSLLNNRERVLACARKPLLELLATGDVRAGIAAALIGSPEAHSVVLSGSTRQTRRGLLAAARLIRQRLPIEEVSRLLQSKDDGLVAAAEAYLVAEDGPEARKLVWARHPGEALILGGTGRYSCRFKRIETELRHAILAKNGPDEIFGLVYLGTRTPPHSILVRVRDGEGTLVVSGNNERRAEKLPAEDLSELRNWLATNEVESMAPLRLHIHGGILYEYIRLTRNGGVRVYMNNPGCGSPWDIRYSRLVRRFRDLAEE